MSLFGSHRINNESEIDYNRRIRRENDAWNAAIEEAAKCAEINIDDCEIHNLIRKLKK